MPYVCIYSYTLAVLVTSLSVMWRGLHAAGKPSCVLKKLNSSCKACIWQAQFACFGYARGGPYIRNFFFGCMHVWDVFAPFVPKKPCHPHDRSHVRLSSPYGEHCSRRSFMCSIPVPPLDVGLTPTCVGRSHSNCCLDATATPVTTPLFYLVISEAFSVLLSFCAIHKNTVCFENVVVEPLE